MKIFAYFARYILQTFTYQATIIIAYCNMYSLSGFSLEIQPLVTTVSLEAMHSRKKDKSMNRDEGFLSTFLYLWQTVRRSDI